MSFVLKARFRHIVLLLVVLFTAHSDVFSQTFNAWLKAGDEAFTEARYSEAIEYYKKALEFETGDVALDYRMAEACRLYKDYEKAEAWYAKVFGNDKTNTYPLALFYLAEMKKYNADYGTA
ncbi:MAG: tetratricopeptide repeat protein, partial [Bacteroidota bacterium]